MRVTLEVDLAKIKHNIKKVCELIAPSKLTAVVKANAYGLGAIEVAKICKEAGADSLGVANLDEALELKRLGLPIMILGSVLPREISDAIKNDIILPVNNFKEAQQICREAVKQNKSVQCQILVDSGMGRLGVLLENAHQEIKKIIKLVNLKFIGIYSHFSMADNTENDYTNKQIKSFQSLLKALEADGIFFDNIHTANSNGINNYSAAFRKPFNRVRMGLNIYGFSNPELHALKSVVSLKSKLILKRKLPAKSFVGYANTHCLEQYTLIGTIAAGYADGLPLALSNSGHVLIRGQKCPIIGRISMDYTTVDLSQVPKAECGDKVVFIGEQGEEVIPLQCWAKIKKTHAHDILCAITLRTKRIYIK